MKRLHLRNIAVAIVAVASVAAIATAGSPLGIGTAAVMTDYKMESVDGSWVSFDSVKGEKGTLVVFSCNECPWVIGWEERMTKLFNKVGEHGVGVLYVNSNDPAISKSDRIELMKARSDKRGFKFHYVVDKGSKLAHAYGATRTPEAFLFDSNNTLVYHGTIDDNMRNAAAVEKTYLKDAIKALINGEEIATKETKALGCTIKFSKSTD